ncbi:MAG: citrate/2-methylcitrate synthase [bacterium]|nr:citrate/2-methylcitrate synthase [bacterium]
MMAEAQAPVAAQGLRGVVIGDSKLSLVDGENGRLIYAGYKIQDLAENALFEEVVFLLWNNRLPNAQELETLREQIAEGAVLPQVVIDKMKAYPKDINPMAMLRTVVSMLAFYDPESEDMSIEAVKRKALRMTGQITTICAAWDRIRKGHEVVQPRRDYNLAQNFMYMLTGEEPNKTAVDAINTYLVLLAEHGMNASTFTARVVTATGSDIYSAIVAAIGALKGPSHGGANAEAMQMFLDIGEVDNVESWFNTEFKGKGRKIMGIGHAIYKALDPRAIILKEKARELAQSSGNLKWFQVAEKLDDTARADQHFIERRLYANVDYYSAIVLYTINLDIDMFTPLFAMARIAGWSAHVIEQMGGKLIRPDVNYVGAMDLPWTPVDQR